MIKKLVFLFLLAAGSSGGKAFGQKQLSDFVNQAFQNSPLLKTNNIQSQANELDAQRLVAALTKPAIGTEVNYLFAPIYSSDPGNSGLKLNPSKTITDYYGYDLSATNGGLYRGLITFDQPLFNQQRINAVNEQATLQNQILSNNSTLSKHELEKLVTDQYLLCLQDVHQQEAVAHIVDIIGQQISITRKLSANGLAKQGDYKVLEIELKQQETNIQSLRNSYKVHLLELYSICGMSDTATVSLAVVSLDLTNAADINNSGFVKQYQLDSLSLSASQKLFNTQYKPVVSLYSSAGLNAVYAPDMYKRLGWQVGIRFTQKFFDGHQKKLNDQKTKLLQQTTAINSDFFNQKNESRKNALMQAIRSIDEQLQSIQQQISDYDTLLSYYQRQITNGQSSVIEYITVLRSSAALQFSRIALQTNRLIAINNYNYWNW
ncbi:TolC family protein [Parafilimonas sp.]|uniref:TolC family protein n=1 Tax=Parafilimonas sp. TaxID=1969739 RepID=UPI003F81F50B